MERPRKRKRIPVRRLVERLAQLYPEPQCELRHRNPFELLIATILSAQCTDERVNRVTETLFRKYTRPEDYLEVDAEELERDIHPTGFFRSKAKNIRGACRRLLEAYEGRVPDRMEDLLALPGVARKTANVVLSTVYGRAEGFVVDTHVSRLARRFGLTEHTDPARIERDLMALFPRKDWIWLGHALVLHGRYVCTARNPHCAECALNDICPAAFEETRRVSPRSGSSRAAGPTAGPPPAS